MDVLVSLRVLHAPRLEAPMVFAGYGLTIPELKYDDLAGLDVKGKVVVLLTGIPPGSPRPSVFALQHAALESAPGGWRDRGNFDSITQRARTSLGIVRRRTDCCRKWSSKRHRWTTMQASNLR